MTYVVLTAYTDGLSENLYTGEDLMQAVRAIMGSYVSEFRIQIWQDGKLIEELRK